MKGGKRERQRERQREREGERKRVIDMLWELRYSVRDLRTTHQASRHREDIERGHRKVTHQGLPSVRSRQSQ